LIVGLRGILAALDDAETEREVVEIVRDSLAQLTADDLTSLPAECRPGRIRDHHDIAEYALRLGRRRLEEDTLSDAALVYDLFEILQWASARGAILAAPRASPPGEAGDPTLGASARSKSRVR
jgi:hypothetical protein